jgi:hypothetical protein
MGVAKVFSGLWRFLCLLISFGLTSPALAGANSYTACIGEYARNCGKHDTYAYCYTNPEKLAASTCTITDSEGKSKTSPHRVIHLSTKGGNKCGYVLLMITCFDP